MKNPFKILPKSSKNPPQTHLPKKTSPKCSPKSIFGASWASFGEYLEGPGVPNPPNMAPTSKKTARNSMLQKTIFSNMIFHQIFNVFAFKNGSKIYKCSNIFQKPRLCKNRCLSDSEPPKIEKSSILEANMEASWHQNRIEIDVIFERRFFEKTLFFFRKNTFF